MNKWFLLGALTTFGALPANAAPPAPVLASVSESGGNAGGIAFVLYSAPEMTVYADGTAVWADQSKRNHMDKIDPESWRVGKVSRAALKQFRAAALANKFFAITPQPVAPTVGPNGEIIGMAVNDAATTTIAVQFGGHKRIVSEYALESEVAMGKDPVYVQAVTATRDAILALKPAQSTACKPAFIRVGVFEAYGVNSPAGVPWPLTAPLAVTEGRQWSVYGGAEAKAVMNALAQSTFVTSGGHLYMAAWVPNIDIPANPPAK